MKLFIMYESVNIEITLQCVQCYNNLRTMQLSFNPLSAKPTKWSNTLKQFVVNLPTNCLNVFDHFVILPLKGLKKNGICHSQLERKITERSQNIEQFYHWPHLRMVN